MLTKHSQEGKTTEAVEKQTSKIPSMVYLNAGLGAMLAAACLMYRGRKHAALLIGQWTAPLLIMGLYNKIVKTEGHDSMTRK